MFSFVAEGLLALQPLVYLWVYIPRASFVSQRNGKTRFDKTLIPN
tara:strand:+ start:67 stop:201 length:135 start_codon:yes stop_codon:yes gene_type:complete